MTAFLPKLRALARDRSGLALIEFAFAAPLFALLFLTGAELTNYTITRMRLSQVALHLADNMSRIGNGSMLQAKTITEADINDVLTGAGLQGGSLDIYEHGRVIVSSLEPVANPNTSNRYKIRWQRCRGSVSHASSYGKAGDTNLTGIGPAGRQVIAVDGGATMFVELYYEYTPLLITQIHPERKLIEVASMMVRDRRDLSSGTGHTDGIYQVSGVTPSTC